MLRYRVDADAQRIGDLLIARALGQVVQHLPLALRQRGEFRRQGMLSLQPGGDLGLHARTVPRLALRYRLHCIGEGEKR